MSFEARYVKIELPRGLEILKSAWISAKLCF